MKSIIRIMTFASAAALLAAGCSREKIDFGGQEPSQQEVGYLVLPGMTVNTDAEIVDDTRATVNAPDDYVVTVTNVNTGEAAFTDTYGAIQQRSEPIPLAPGFYKVDARSPNASNIPVMAWNTPAYRGATATPIEITSKQTSELTDPVVCKLANIRVSVYLDEALKSLFKNDGTNDVSTVVSLGDSGMKFTRDENRSAYFKAVEESNTLRVVLSGEYNVGTDDEPNYKPVSMTQNISGVKAGQWRKISVSVQHSAEGNVQFVITIETFVNDETIDVDVMSSEYTFGEEAIPDGDQSDPDAPAVTLDNGHDIAAPFVISSSIFNDEGYCTDRIAVSVAPQGGATVETIDAVIDSDSESFLAALASAGFTKNTIPLTGDLAVDGTTYVTVRDNGSGKLLTASSAAMKRMLDSYAGTHTVKFVVTDSQHRTSYTTLTIQVKAGAVSQEGPVIEWQGHDIDTRYNTNDLAGEKSVVIDITSKTGITGFTVDISGTALPEAELVGFGLAAHMDLVNVEGDMAVALSNLGFPTGDQVKTTALSFDISQFMPMLADLNFGGDCNFKLTVTDASGTNAKTIMVYVPVN